MSKKTRHDVASLKADGLISYPIHADMPRLHISSLERIQHNKRHGIAIEADAFPFLPSGRDESPRSLKEGVPQWAPTRHQIVIMMTLSLISFMAALDSCVIVTSLNAIIVDLDLSTTEGIWIGTAYLLANAVTMPLLAEASNIFGRPTILTSCLMCFTLGSLLCSVAYNIALLLVGRTFQGVGGAGIMVLSLVIFTDIVPLRFRPRWYGLVDAVAEDG
ncbi:major facilitator superfamily transporter [Diaporthe amygdali]|uniref:major facilitator superfamily transporter n=1 Tax=Phomopsis amygdali TaxID=1214568 RepID=UPI0022FDE68C|nr:major facilitator superfamily transporter [Diaporthe amygdali]KAJ0100643.1 major facilitator superfamily transporter [Diaporthe amygdali]